MCIRDSFNSSVNPERRVAQKYLLETLSEIDGNAFHFCKKNLNMDKLSSDLTDDVRWLKSFTEGRIDYIDEEIPKPLLDESSDENSNYNFLYKLCVKLLRDKVQVDARLSFFSGYANLGQNREIAANSIERALSGVNDTAFLLNASHLLRLKKEYSLSLIALDRAIVLAIENDENDFLDKARKSRKSTAALCS